MAYRTKITGIAESDNCCYIFVEGWVAYNVLCCVGYTLRRLAAKCANNAVITRRSQALQPQQLGVGVSGGLKQPFMQHEG